MRTIASIFGALLIAFPATAAPAPERPSARTNNFCIVGYLPGYRVASFRQEQAAFLTDLIYFSIEPDDSGGLRRRETALAHLKTLQPLKQKNAGLRLLVCVGGWERSGAFARMTASVESRHRFSNELTRFCLEAGIDGADVDWEHPFTAAETQNFGLLISELKQAFTPHHLQLTLAVAGWQGLPAEAIRSAERIHLMAYDATGEHAPFTLAQTAVAQLEKLGAPPGKICLGVPFYGRRRTPPGDAMTYAEIVRNHHPAPDLDEVAGVSFNGLSTIRRKTEFARTKNLAGIMAWELGPDTLDAQSLLRAIFESAPK